MSCIHRQKKLTGKEFFCLCNSRYYDPEIGRFINADGYASTGQGILGHNMFAYCANNPVNCADPTGHFLRELWEIAQTAITEIGSAFGSLSQAFAGCAIAATVDGPFFAGDILGSAAASLLAVGAIGYGIYRTAQIYSNKQEASIYLCILIPILAM